MNRIDSILRDARQLIEDPARWTQGCYARAADGTPTPYDKPAACRWCLEGAVMKAAQDVPVEERDLAVYALYTTLNPVTPYVDGGTSIHVFNDTSAHGRVLDLIDRTLVRLSKVSL